MIFVARPDFWDLLKPRIFAVQNTQKPQNEHWCSPSALSRPVMWGLCRNFETEKRQQVTVLTLKDLFLLMPPRTSYFYCVAGVSRKRSEKVSKQVEFPKAHRISVLGGGGPHTIKLDECGPWKKSCSGLRNSRSCH